MAKRFEGVNVGDLMYWVTSSRADPKPVTVTEIDRKHNRIMFTLPDGRSFGNSSDGLYRTEGEALSAIENYLEERVEDFKHRKAKVQEDLTTLIETDIPKAEARLAAFREKHQATA